MKKILAFFAVMAAVSAQTAFSQDITLTFTGARTDGAYVVLDSVQVQNISRSWTETVVYPDTVLSFPQSGSGIADVQGVAASLSAYPNPFNGAVNVAVATPQSTNATVQVFNLAGQKIVEQSMALQAGDNLLEVRLQEPQVHILAVTTPQGRSTIKLINSRQGSENAVLSRGTGVVIDKLQSAQTFQFGDTLKIVGYTSFPGTTAISREIQRPVNESETFVLMFETESSDYTLSGEFSVTSKKRVRFSSGNLQYTTVGSHAVAGGGTAHGTWRFAPHQWDTISMGNRNISPTYTGWIDLFGWGTSGWNSGNYFYQPYDTMYSVISPYTPQIGFGYGPIGYYDLTGTYANADWGVYNAISNGGNEPGMWRTLTSPEWDTLLNYRTTTSGKRYAKAYVNGVGGIIILPDNWSTSTYTLNSTNTPNAAYSANNITATQWTTLETAGCVFLPGAHLRAGTLTAWSVYPSGQYWSASTKDDYGAYVLSFSNTLLNTTSIYYRHFGYSVRLVQDVH